MKPSFPQKPPLLVLASTCLTTWEQAAIRLCGWAAGSQPAAPPPPVPGALSSPRKGLRPPREPERVVGPVEGIV